MAGHREYGNGPWPVFSQKHRRLIGHLHASVRLYEGGDPLDFAVQSCGMPSSGPNGEYLLPEVKVSVFPYDHELKGFIAPAGAQLGGVRAFVPL